MSTFSTFDIWRRHHTEAQWGKTSHSVRARTDKEAQSKMKRYFEGCGFSSMSLVAMLSGTSPNQESVK